MAASPGSIARAPTDGQLRLITKVARMYHERGIRQTDIAESLHISQARVSRLLKRAAELGIVRTVVAVAPGVNTEIEEALEETYGLAEAVVVDVEGFGIGRCDLLRDHADERRTHRDLQLEPNSARRCRSHAALPNPRRRECHSADGRIRKFISPDPGQPTPQRIRPTGWSDRRVRSSSCSGWQ